MTVCAVRFCTKASRRLILRAFSWCRLMVFLAMAIAGGNMAYASTPAVSAFSGSHAQYTITAMPSAGIQVQDTVSGRDGAVLLTSTQRFQFTNANIAFDVSPSNSAGGIFRLYQAAFNRTPDLRGLGYWIFQSDSGMDANTMAAGFVYSSEFQSLYGVKVVDSYATGVDIVALLTVLYGNVLHRQPDAGGLAYYVGKITSRSLSLGEVLAQFADSPENHAQDTVLNQNGILYIAWSSVNPTPTPSLQAMGIAVSSVSIYAGKTATFSATGYFTDGTLRTLVPGITWASQSPSVLTIDNTGLATAVSVGGSTVSAAFGGKSFSVPVTVLDPGSVIGGVPGIYTLGGTVSNLSASKSLVLLNNGGDAVTVNANGTFSFPTLLAPGAQYTVSVRTQPSGMNCVVANGTGTATANVNAVTVSCYRTPAFAYAANWGSNTVSVYVVNPSTGALTSVGSAVPTGSSPVSVTVDPTGRFAYVANNAANTVSTYVIGTSTGTLSPVGSAVATGAVPVSMAIDRSGRFAYVANNVSNTVSAYAINASTGRLTPVGSDVATGAAPRAVTVDPTSKFVYVANYNSNNVSAYTINAATGALTPVGAAVASGAAPLNLVVEPTGRFAYVANWIANTVSAYSINASTGGLVSIGPDFATGSNPAAVTVDPSGKFAYVTNASSNSISAYTIHASTGALTTVGTVPAAGVTPVPVTVDPTGKFAYVANYASNSVTTYTIDAVTGALAAGATVTAGRNPIAVVVAPSQ